MGRGERFPPPPDRKSFKGLTMTPQIQNVIRRLSAHHGYSAVFVRKIADGIFLYSVGGIMYRLRGDGTIL